MDVGQLNADLTSFDLDNLDETDSLITRTATATMNKIRWLYKDEAGRLVVLEKTDAIKNVFQRGTPLCISAVSDGISEPKHAENKEAATTVGRLAIDVDFENLGALPTRMVTDSQGVTHVAALVPVILS